MESDDYKLGHKELPEKLLLLPDQYKEILAHLINIKIVQEKMLFTTYGSPPEELTLTSTSSTCSKCL